MKRIMPVSAIAFLVGGLLSTATAQAKVLNIARDPYQGAIVIDDATGTTIFEDRADLPAYPASIAKLMDLLIILERIEKGTLSLSETVIVTAQASRMGGSQVYLKEKEVFTVEHLLYALMIQSANDAATALAIHIAGSTEAFVELMNRRAKELGMSSTRYTSVHGLPPSYGGNPDVTTPRDQAILARALVRRPDVLRYTSTRVRGFRNDTFIMRNHNHLLTEFPGCDGLKTGFFSAAGFSIVATAVRNDRRIIAVVMSSKSRTGRDDEAKKLLSKGFLELPPLPPPVPVITNTVPPPKAAVSRRGAGAPGSGKKIMIGGGILLVLIWALASFFMRRSRPTGF